MLQGLKYPRPHDMGAWRVKSASGSYFFLFQILNNPQANSLPHIQQIPNRTMARNNNNNDDDDHHHHHHHHPKLSIDGIRFFSTFTKNVEKHKKIRGSWNFGPNFNSQKKSRWKISVVVGIPGRTFEFPAKR